MSVGLRDGEEYSFERDGQRWVSSWHGAGSAPLGRSHGSAGICVTDAGEVVLVSADGASWDFPAGRPEAGESWEDTLRREMREEACAIITNARLLGFARGRCVEGHEVGLILVRSIWLARVALLEWRPQFETRFRRIVSPAQALAHTCDAYEPIWKSALAAADLA